MTQLNPSKRKFRTPRGPQKDARELRSALDQHAVVDTTDSYGRIVEVNDRFCALLQYTRSELLGRDHRIVNSGYHSPEFFRQMWDTIAAGAIWRGDIFNRAKDGSFCWTDTTIVPLLGDDGRPRQYIAIRTDISARKKAEIALKASEAALRQSQARLRYAAHAAGLTYAEFDFLANRAAAGENYARVMGYVPLREDGFVDVSTAIGRLVEHVGPEDRPFVQEKIRSAQTGEFPVVEAEYRVVGEDGVKRWIKSVGLSALGANGQLERIFVTNLDVSKQVEAREEVVRARANADQARNEAEQANQAKSKFLAAASHDLRQPVQSLALLMALVERQVTANPEARATLAMMQKALDGLNSLLTAILDVSRLDAGVVARLEPVDLAALLRRLALEYKPKADSVGLVLRVSAPGLWASADPALLERAIRNLIDNAIRYTRAGGVLLGLRRRKGRVRIDVVDTGIGIPQERQADIFEEFVQIDNPGRHLGLGLGLGLAIVTRIAKLLGAPIEVNSRVGRGSRFSLILSCVEAATADEDESEAEFEDPGGRVLIVEDNAIVLQSLEAALAQWGYETATSSTGEEALRLAEAQGWSFGAIVTDQHLGAGMTGLETAKEIVRRSGRYLPALILTGDTSKEGIAEFAASGFLIMHKPIAPGSLRRGLAELMSG